MFLLFLIITLSPAIYILFKISEEPGRENNTIEGDVAKIRRMKEIDMVQGMIDDKQSKNK
jgi:hypothetical protein